MENQSLDKSLDRQGLLSTNRREDTALVITTPRSSTRSFTDDLAPGLSTKDRAHWDHLALHLAVTKTPF